VAMRQVHMVMIAQWAPTESDCIWAAGGVAHGDGQCKG